jgi:hypothetical protein
MRYIQGIGTGDPDEYGVLHVIVGIVGSIEKEIVLCMGLSPDVTISTSIESSSAIPANIKGGGYRAGRSKIAEGGVFIKEQLAKRLLICK